MLSSITKFKKSLTKGMVLGSLWVGSTSTSCLPLNPLCTTTINVLKLKIYEMPSTPHSIRHSIIKSMLIFLMKSLTSPFHHGLLFWKRSSDLPYPIATTHLLLAPISCHGATWRLFSKIMIVSILLSASPIHILK